MPCPADIHNTRGDGIASLASDGTVDLVSLAWTRAYGKAADEARGVCRGAGIVDRCIHPVFAGITSVTIERNIVQGRESAKVELRVRWRCEDQNPPPQAIIDSHAALGCGVVFSMSATAEVSIEANAAPRAIQLAQQAAQRVCDLMPCTLVQEQGTGPAPIPIPAATSTFKATYTSSYKCVTPPPVEETPGGSGTGGGGTTGGTGGGGGGCLVVLPLIPAGLLAAAVMGIKALLGGHDG